MAALCAGPVRAGDTDATAAGRFPGTAQTSAEPGTPAPSAQDKLDPRIARALKKSRIAATAEQTALDPDIPISDGSRVLVDLDAAVSDGLREQVALVGGQLAASPDPAHVIRAMVPLAQLEALAARADVRFISPAQVFVTRRLLAAPSSPGGAGATPP